MLRLHPAVADLSPEEFERRVLRAMSNLATISKKASCSMEEAEKSAAKLSAALSKIPAPPGGWNRPGLLN